MSENTTKKFINLQTKVTKAQEEASKATGALDQIMQRLKDEFDCSTIEEAKNLLKKLEKKSEKEEKEFETALEKFENEWKEQLT